MMKSKWSFLPLIIFIILNSCDYTPTGSFYREIVFIEPNLNLVALNENQTTLIRGRIGIPFTAALDGKNLIAVKVYLDNNYLSSYYNPSDIIDFDSRKYTDGNHTVKLELFTTTNTGSLADIAGAEAYVLTKQYNIQIFNAAITTPQITSMQVINNALRIKWDKYEGPGFQKYVLVAYNQVITEIYDQDVIEIEDPAFVGGNCDRAIRTSVCNETFESTHKPFNYAQTNFTSATVNDQNQVELTWQKNIFTNAFGSYKIKRASTVNEYLAEISDINTLNFIDIDPLFGSEIRYEIMSYPILPVYVYYNPNYITSPPVGQDCDYPKNSYLRYVPGKDLYYAYYNKKFRIYDNSMNLVMSRTYQFSNDYIYFNTANSSDGELIYVISGGKIAKINSSTLAVDKLTNMDSLAGRQLGTIYGVSVSDNNTLAIICWANNINLAFHVFDMNTGDYLASQNLYEYWYDYDIQISRNGKYIRVVDNLYQLYNNTLTFTGNVEPYSFFMNDSESLVQFINNQNKAQKLRCTDLGIISEITFPRSLSQPMLKVDPGSNYIGCDSYSTGSFYILDMETAQIKKRIPIIDYGILLQNMTLFASNKMLKVTL